MVVIDPNAEYCFKILDSAVMICGIAIYWQTKNNYLLIAQSLLTESSKISCPESCFFFDPSEVPL